MAAAWTSTTSAWRCAAHGRACVRACASLPPPSPSPHPLPLLSADHSCLAAPQTHPLHCAARTCARAQIVAPLLRVLEKAHTLGLMHRDIKPENIFLTRKGRFKLGDFGGWGGHAVHRAQSAWAAYPCTGTRMHSTSGPAGSLVPSAWAHALAPHASSHPTACPPTPPHATPAPSPRPPPCCPPCCAGLAINVAHEVPFSRSGTLDYMSPEVRAAMGSGTWD
jgi:serine/threonine protein kinase